MPEHRSVRDEIAAAYDCDRRGDEHQAVVHYDAAYALGVPEDERTSFLIGYGSTLRNVGRLRESVAILHEASSRATIDDEAAIRGFGILTELERGRANAAVAQLLDAWMSAEPAKFGSYRRALESYRDELQGRDATRHPKVVIRYCPKCRWLTRASWLAQELLTTFDSDIEVTLAPASSGTFEVTLDGELVFSRKQTGRFPEPKELKQQIRDRAFPDRELGHSDRSS